MSECCERDRPAQQRTASPSAPRPSPCCGSSRAGEAAGDECPLTYFRNWIPRCLAYCESAKAAGRPVVGICCEYTPRELILAAGGVPVCLCGGSADTIGAAEQHLPANLCPLIKSTYGYHVQKANPFLEMADLVVAETTCDGKKKMYELMARDRAVYVLELPQKPREAAAMAYWKAELARFRDELRRRFGAGISDDCLRRAIRDMNRERSLRRRIARLMAGDCPPLTGRELIDFKSAVSCIPSDAEQYERAIETLAGRNGPEERAGRARVLMTGVPMAHGAERVLEIIEGRGGLVVCLENCTGVKPVLDDVSEDADDPLDALADKYFHLPCSVMTPNADRLDVLRRLAAEYRPQCIIELIWQACLTYDVESFLVRRFVEDELGLPYLRIETDYSPSDSARIAVRVEALFETVRAARGGTVGGADDRRVPSAGHGEPDCGL